MSGYYSIVQFMPNLKRHEGVNVGVMLLEPSTGLFNFILTRPVRQIQSRFNGTSESQIVQENLSFYNTVMAQEFHDLDSFTSFCLARYGGIHCTEPEWTSVGHGRFSVVLQDLLQELVF